MRVLATAMTKEGLLRADVRRADTAVFYSIKILMDPTLPPNAGVMRPVEIRVPEGFEGPRFVSPTNFAGRLVPFKKAGVRHARLPESVGAQTEMQVPADAWVLIDGCSPRASRWATALVALFIGFSLWNVVGIARVLGPGTWAAAEAGAACAVAAATAVARVASLRTRADRDLRSARGGGSALISVNPLMDHSRRRPLARASAAGGR